jgi:hypothetical protein
MHVPYGCRPTLQCEGVVRRVDLVGREVLVHVAGTPVSFDVRLGCVITLRGERVKLRLIQPRDRVRVAYTESQGARVADAIEVRTGGPAPTT